MRMDMRNAHGWQVFTATMMLVLGVANLVQGIVGMGRSAFYAVAESGLLMFNFAFWGTVLTVWGLLMLACGIALMTGAMWARTASVLVLAINLVAQFAFLMAFPHWSLALLAADVLVIYGLTVGWHASAPGGAADEAAGEAAAYGAGREAAHAKPEATRAPQQGRHEQPMG
ncbi:DUF7144 family membrane protein [Nocardiopsis composta]|uniref:DUF7144 domain-containing protein n=1 Tax=Nocardiopsis composta TaxID=157465 RepID=A0A7W8QMD3_9ACTN|nr:hypothetical protein [Nocardiopsis composta]MBB5432644.1 hypothetical protein [Nocardiopsis composta]